MRITKNKKILKKDMKNDTKKVVKNDTKKDSKKDKKEDTKKVVKKVVKKGTKKVVKKVVKKDTIETDTNETDINETDNIETNNESIKIETFESKLSKCIKSCNLFEEDNKEDQYIRKSSTYQNEEEYQNSFDNIISFSKRITLVEKNNIECVMFHAGNEDGLMAAYYTYKYFENKKELLFIPTKPSSSDTQLNYRIQKFDYSLKNKNLIILDLSFGKANYDYLSKICKSIIIIDDHMKKNNILKKYPNINYFVGDDKHCASVYTFKFFNPKINVPLNLIYIDNNDRKLQLPFINHKLYTYIRTYNNFKIVHSPYLNINFTKNEDFLKMEELLNSSYEYKLLVGKLYDEVSNNIKLQVTMNARKKTFCGHPVYILNYNDPVIYKMVSREMFSLAERKGDNIDFAVLYGYEFTSDAYKIFVSEKHTGRPPRFTHDLNNILHKYGKYTFKGGIVSKYVLNFYYPHNDKYDIWDLIKN